MTLKLNGSSSGYTAIDAPASAGSNTLVLPADNGSNGEFLQTNGSGTLDWAGAGKILQVATGTTTTEAYKSGNTTYGDTGLTATITPASGTKIVVIINQAWYCGRNNSEGEASMWIKTLRDSTMLQETKLGYTMMARTWQEIWSHFSFTYLDTHGADGSTAVVYKTQYKAGNGDTEAYVQRDAAGETNRANILLLEVGA